MHRTEELTETGWQPASPSSTRCIHTLELHILDVWKSLQAEASTSAIPSWAWWTTEVCGKWLVTVRKTSVDPETILWTDETTQHRKYLSFSNYPRCSDAWCFLGEGRQWPRSPDNQVRASECTAVSLLAEWWLYLPTETHCHCNGTWPPVQACFYSCYDEDVSQDFTPGGIAQAFAKSEQQDNHNTETEAASQTSDEMTPANSSTMQEESRVTEEEDIWSSLYKSFTQAAQQEQQTPAEDSTVQTLTREMDDYLQLPLLDRNSSELDWWKQHTGQFPHLCVLAKKFLATPASSV